MMKKLLIFFVIVILVGCQSVPTKQAAYSVLYSYDQVKGFDSTSIVLYDKNGRIVKERSFSGTLYQYSSFHNNKTITNNGEKIVELDGDKIIKQSYKDNLSAFPSLCEPFEYNQKLYWFVDGGLDGVYSSHLYCYDTKAYITMSNGAINGYTQDEKYLYVSMGNNWHNGESEKETALKIVTIDLDSFKIVKEVVTSIPTAYGFNLLENGKKLYNQDQLLFAINVVQEDKKEPYYLCSVSLKDGSVKKILDLSQYNIMTGKYEDQFQSNGMIYNDSIYLSVCGGRVYKIIQKDNTYVLEQVLTLPDCEAGSISVSKLIDNRIIFIYRKNNSEGVQTLIEYNLDDLSIVNETTLEKIYYIFGKKSSKDVLKL